MCWKPRLPTFSRLGDPNWVRQFHSHFWLLRLLAIASLLLTTSNLEIETMDKITTKQQAIDFLSKFDDFLFDCDGVLWHGDHLLPHVKETIELLRKLGKRLIFVTNNSTKSRSAYTQKFLKFGIQVDKEEIFGSAYSCALYLDRVANFDKENKKVFILGERGIEEELESVGIRYVGGTDPKFNASFYPGSNNNNGGDIADEITRDPSIGAVICGLDLHINYYKVAYAMQQLTADKETLFLATNIDSTYPAGKGKLFPGAGTCVSMLQTCSGRNPIATGKPSKAMMDCIKSKFHFNSSQNGKNINGSSSGGSTSSSRVCMIGDRLNTDMVFGKQGGLGTFFVLTGIDSEQSGRQSTLVTPDYYADRLGVLYELIEGGADNNNDA